MITVGSDHVSFEQRGWIKKRHTFDSRLNEIVFADAYRYPIEFHLDEGTLFIGHRLSTDEKKRFAKEIANAHGVPLNRSKPRYWYGMGKFRRGQ